jgi:hypothetical protein
MMITTAMMTTPIPENHPLHEEMVSMILNNMPSLLGLWAGQASCPLDLPRLQL